MAPAQERLPADAFFARLSSLLTAATDAKKNSIFMSQKALPETSELLMRATNGSSKPEKRIKIATVVPITELEAFYVRYAEVMKAGCGSLKKRDRKKRKVKKKGKAAAGETAV